MSSRNRGRFWKRSEDLPTFRLSAFGRDFVLHLVPDDSFLAPEFKIQRITAKHSHPSDILTSVNETEGAEAYLRRCFYSGTVDSNQDSVVAVSLCQGIQGSFLSDGDEYLIEPKATGNGKKSTTQLHLIKRRAFTNTSTGSKITFDEMGEGSSQADSSESGLSPEVLDAHSHSRNSRPMGVCHYILTLISVAARMYKHPSIKNSVNLVVVKVLIVEDEEVGPAVSSNGGLTLRNFCAWQRHFNPPSDRHPEHYDTALLFTRQDICGHQSCDTLGVADVGTMCDPNRSCSVIEDDGLQASFTAAHELGHVLSMPHDDSKTCEKLFGDLGKHHMMAPLFIHLNKTLPWSPCSAMYITEFFDNGHGDCLLDAPAKTMPLPTGLPGLSYDLDRQCQQVFGEEFLHCPNTADSDVCSQLWCRVEGQPLCTTKNGSLPWADGTACGKDKLCFNNECVEKEQLMKPKTEIDGNWGAWGEWGDCSRTCGGGVQFSYRECNDPGPQNGGKYCEGQRVKYLSCNIQECPDDNGKSLREEQCEKYNSVSYLDMDGNVKQWIPKYAGVSPRDRCKLFCRARGSSEFKVFEPKVIDGTPCGPDTTSICVQGQCIKAGCDLIIGSNKKLDKCGVCGENGSTCRKITGSLNKASQEMLGKLNMLRNEGHFCDVTIRVQDKVFMAHKVVLASCSEFFRTKLVGKLQEEDKCVLDLNHVTVSGFTPLLEYAYTSTLTLNTENIIDVLAAASYMQMFTVASTCSEFMKSSILWNSANNTQQEKPQESAPENSTNCTFTPQDGSVSPVSSECSVIERTIPVYRESRRKRKSYIMMSPESPLKCSMQNTSPQIQNATTSFTETQSHPVDSSLAFPWTFPFGIDRRFQSEKPKQAESPRSLEQPGPSDVTRRLDDYLSCEGTKATSPLVAEEDVHVKVERLSDEEVPEEVSQPVSASQSSLSDQQTVPGSEQVHEDLLISPQSSSIGIKPFQCDRCGKKFTRAYSLKMHRLKHEGKRCFRCQICSATFTSFGEYKHHMRVSRHIIRKPRIYECKTCGAMFTNSGNLIVHLRSLNHEASELANYFQSRQKPPT
ncbi:UNVERIFIED_CONTAM: hypothetical protein FKN15_013007 [Acipenser sinensis]